MRFLSVHFDGLNPGFGLLAARLHRPPVHAALLGVKLSAEPLR
jgi:hypothetical protein